MAPPPPPHQICMCGKERVYCEKMRKTCVDLALAERTVAVISATRGRGVGIPPVATEGVRKAMKIKEMEGAPLDDDGEDELVTD
jgi:hypothetical protein